MKKLLLSFLFFVGVNIALAQTAQSVAPDCQFAFSFTTTGGSQPAAGYANYAASGVTGGGACTTWVVTYRGFSVVGSPSLLFQQAPAATLSTPGSFVTYAGTIITGVNPNTSATGAQTFFSNGVVASPFVRVTLSGITSGTIAGTVYGYKQGFSGNGSSGGGGGGGGCVGTVMTPCVVEGPAADGAATAGNPVVTGYTDGVDTHQSVGCNESNFVNASMSGDSQLIAGVMGERIRICKITLTTASPVTIYLESASAGSCGGSKTQLTAVYQNAITVAEDFVADLSIVTVPVSANLCINLGSSVSVTGAVYYVQF